LRRLDDMLDRRWLTNAGKYVGELEDRLTRLLGVKHCIAMCSGTIALEIAIRALGLAGEVIVPSLTFVATAHALQWQELTPVFCDVDPQGYNIDPVRAEELITPRTSGIVGVHLWGRPCDVTRLASLAESHNLRLIFDAAHALGCSHGGSMIGGFGAAEVFSFHATKFINSFEGGAVATNDDEVAARIRLMKNFGFRGYDNVVCIGTNGKMSEASAAMGLTSLESMDEFTEVNRNNYWEYRRALEGISGVSLMRYDETERCNFQYIVIDLDPDLASVTRDTMVRVLHAENVMARRYFFPGCHRMEPYRSIQPHAWMRLPNTEKVVKRIMVLPTGTAVQRQDIATVAQVIRIAMGNGAELMARMGSLASAPDPVAR
jgi:dTDP-4-amino-4,6-dideoxygalactose transaminase